MKVKVVQLRENATIPVRATEGASGYDLYATEHIIIPAGETKKIPLGLAFEIPLGLEMQIRPRSGMSLKTKLRISNSPGTIDSDYRGEVAVLIDNIGKEDHLIKAGQRFAQAVFCPVVYPEFEIVQNLSESKRGHGGFGHTGS